MVAGGLGDGTAALQMEPTALLRMATMVAALFRSADRRGRTLLQFSNCLLSVEPCRRRFGGRRRRSAHLQPREGDTRQGSYDLPSCPSVCGYARLHKGRFPVV